MSMIEHAQVPAGWYPDGVTDDSLRWWDGGDWTHDVRPLAAPLLVAVAPIEFDYVAAQSLPVDNGLPAAPEDISGLLAAASVQQAGDPAPAMSRRQLRELLGGPLVTEAPIDK